MNNSALQADAGLFTSIDIKDYQKRISELHRANLDLKMMIIEKDNRISQILDGKVNQTTIVEYLKSTKLVDQLNSQIRSLNFDLDQAKNTISSLEIEKKNQKEIENKLNNEISVLKAKLSYQNENEKLNQTNLDNISISLKLEISKLKQNISAQESKNAELTIELLNLQSKLDDYENGVIKNDSDVSRLRHQLTNANNEISSLKLEISSLKTEISSLNQQIAEKNNKIVNKSKKIRTFKRYLQDNLNETRTLQLKCQKGSQQLQTQMNDFVCTINEKLKSIESNRDLFIRSIIKVMKRNIQNSKIDFQKRISKQADIINALLALSAQIFSLPFNSLPEVDELINDDSSLQLFIGRINTANEMQKAANKSNIDEMKLNIRRLQMELKSQQLSASVSRFVNNLQGTMNDMTKTLHQDHVQLIDALNPTCSELSE